MTSIIWCKCGAEYKRTDTKFLVIHEGADRRGRSRIHNRDVCNRRPREMQRSAR
jgi:hypothetical protein